jgi:hypothetical protein
MAGGAQGLSRTLHRPRQAPQPIGRTLRRMISSARVRVSLIRCEAKYRIAPLLCPVSPTASHHPRPNSRQRCDYHNRPPARSVAPLGSASARARASVTSTICGTGLSRWRHWQAKANVCVPCNVCPCSKHGDGTAKPTPRSGRVSWCSGRRGKTGLHALRAFSSSNFKRDMRFCISIASYT